MTIVEEIRKELSRFVRQTRGVMPRYIYIDSETLMQLKLEAVAPWILSGGAVCEYAEVRRR
jgi:hypothetical protein